MVKKKSNQGGIQKDAGSAGGGGGKANGVSNGPAAAATSSGASKQNGATNSASSTSNGTAKMNSASHASNGTSAAASHKANGFANGAGAAAAAAKQNGLPNVSGAASGAAAASSAHKQNGLSNGAMNGAAAAAAGRGSGASATSSKKSKGGGGDASVQTCSSQSSGGSSGDQSERSSHYERRSLHDHECQVELDVEEDLVEKFARLREWRKMETLGELVALLTPVQRQLMDAMLRGSTAHSKPAVESYQRRINNPRSLEAVQLKESLDKQREMFLPSLSLLTPCNRLSAAVMRAQLHKFMADLPAVVIGSNEEEVQSRVEELLSMVVTALHHPAFSVDSQMELVKMRDYLKGLLHELAPYTQGQSREGPATTIKCMRCLEFKEGPKEAVLELSWTDGMVTYACRSVRQLNDMHRRLLDFFGMEKTNERRALPYFPRQDNFLAVQSYIDQLSNLPARMLLDDKFADEFGDTRIFSSALSSAPVNHAPVRRRARMQEEEDLPYMNDLSLGILPTVEIPALPPPATDHSCPYCAGVHVFDGCPQLALKGVLVNGARMGPEWDRMRCNCCN